MSWTLIKYRMAAVHYITYVSCITNEHHTKNYLTTFHSFAIFALFLSPSPPLNVTTHRPDPTSLCGIFSPMPTPCTVRAFVLSRKGYIITKALSALLANSHPLRLLPITLLLIEALSAVYIYFLFANKLTEVRPPRGILTPRPTLIDY